MSNQYCLGFWEVQNKVAYSIKTKFLYEVNHFGRWLFHFYIITNQTIMKTQQTTISKVRLVYKTKVKTSERLQVKCS